LAAVTAIRVGSGASLRFGPLGDILIFDLRGESGAHRKRIVAKSKSDSREEFSRNELFVLLLVVVIAGKDLAQLLLAQR
jgi:hypothetical protein